MRSLLAKYKQVCWAFAFGAVSILLYLNRRDMQIGSKLVLLFLVLYTTNVITDWKHMPRWERVYRTLIAVLILCACVYLFTL